jgi:hypothetical protein
VANQLNEKQLLEILDLATEGVPNRATAAKVLRTVAQAGSYGSWPSEVTSAELGAALYRLAMNAPEENPLEAILNGWNRGVESSRRFDAALDSLT